MDTASDKNNNSSDDNALVTKVKEKNLSNKRKIGFYYSFLTIVLLLCLMQVGFGVLKNVSKIIAYHSKISKMKKILDTAEIKNKDLKGNINQFSKITSLEEIARNNLKMAGDDEVLIIINANQEQNINKKK